MDPATDKLASETNRIADSQYPIIARVMHRVAANAKRMAHAAAVQYADSDDTAFREAYREWKHRGALAEQIGQLLSHDQLLSPEARKSVLSPEDSVQHSPPPAPPVPVMKLPMPPMPKATSPTRDPREMPDGGE